MKIPKHTAGAARATAQLEKWGLPPILLEKIGAFTVAWGLFESHLERAVWTLKQEQVHGTRPSTDSSQLSDWITVLTNGRADFTIKTNEVLHSAGLAAEDLASYRHSLMHGMLIPLGGKPFFMRNTSWFGAVRKRKFGDAHIDENLLDLAIDAAWILFRVTHAVEKFMSEPYEPEVIETLGSEVGRAKSSANELRQPLRANES